MTATVDIAIVGGGVIGSAIAWFLKGRYGFTGSVRVIEPDPSYAEGATARSLGSLRQQFSVPGNILMSRYGRSFVADLAAHLGIPGEPPPDPQFRPGHYLFLATPSGADGLAANVAVQRATGSDVVLLSPAELKDRMPWINVHDVALAALGQSGEGWLDPWALLRAFRAAAIHAGAVYVRDRVTGLDSDGRHIGTVELASGARLTAGQVVIAAGPWSGAVAALAGIALPVVPRRRTVFSVSAPAPMPDPVLIVDPSGVYVRPEGAGFLTGSSPLDGEPDPDGGPLEPDYARLDDLCWPALANRSALFESLRMTGAWAGYYDYNRFDQNAVLGPHPRIGNLCMACGFSGHGLQQAPAVGRALAEWLLTGASRSLDLDAFRYDRIPAGRPLVERGII